MQLKIVNLFVFFSASEHSNVFQLRHSRRLEITRWMSFMLSSLLKFSRNLTNGAHNWNLKGRRKLFYGGATLGTVLM